MRILLVLTHYGARALEGPGTSKTGAWVGSGIMISQAARRGSGGRLRCRGGARRAVR